jgi:hypothetical protein
LQFFYIGLKKLRGLVFPDSETPHPQDQGMFVRNTLGVMLVAKGESQLALAIDSTVLVSVLDLVRLIPPTASDVI